MKYKKESLTEVSVFLVCLRHLLHLMKGSVKLLEYVARPNEGPVLSEDLLYFLFLAILHSPSLEFCFYKD